MVISVSCFMIHAQPSMHEGDPLAALHSMAKCKRLSNAEEGKS